MALKAKFLEWSFEWISRLLVDSVTEWMTDEEWDKYSMKYGGAVREALRSRAKNLAYDVRVEAVAGRAAVKRLDAAKAESALRNNAITRRTYLEMIDLPDAEGEVIRKREEMLADAAALAGQVTQEGEQGSGALTGNAGGTTNSVPALAAPGNGNGRF
jgi:hypothetical protein